MLSRSALCARRCRSFHPAIRELSKRKASTTTTDSYENVDVVIVGGGPAGLALASALGSSPAIKDNLTVALIEAGDLTKIQEWSASPGDFSNRVSSLTNASQDFLKRTGAWNSVDQRRTCGVEEMQVWDGVSDARIEFNSTDLGAESSFNGMSRMTENLNLQRGLLRHLADMPQVQLLQKTKVQSITRDSDDKQSWPLVHLDNGRVLRSRLLVGADGFNSPVRSFAGISSYGWSYDTQAIVATLEHHPRGAFEGPNTTAYQRFLPTGPIAFLPFSSTASSLVWSTRPHIAKALLSCEPAVLSTMINAAFRLPAFSLKYLYDRILEAHAAGTPITQARLQEEIQFREKAHSIDPLSTHSSLIRHSGPVGIASPDAHLVPPLVTGLQPGTAASFPLRFNHADVYIGEGKGSRTVLVGDAAHTVHPLAGQGLNMGLSDVECLTRCIEKAILHGGDVGSYTALLPYAQERYLANHILMAAVDKLHKLYTTELEPVVWARSVGLEVLNELDSVKAAIMMQAGANAQQHGSPGWNAAASVIQNASAAVETVSAVVPALSRTIIGGIGNLLAQVNQTKRQV
ncbi:hypothetical protein D9611_006401 [Ephemerocybe angulata]|uniref:Ubiquinone biosynthesis monooxygenase COQ6, mitochondrial n=1 Tax=Ephemerocybe angulata TaxID=980116 RepID=A0A8H5C7D7_9AGAR|nr:hypothetical protein D9611_006401 [Tulosesus angulatus]